MIEFHPLHLPLLRELDKAHDRGFRNFLSAIGHKGSEEAHLSRASNALEGLLSELKGTRVPDYGDPYLVAAYLVKFHLSHCALAYWAFRGLFHTYGIPRTLYVCDIGAGTGAGRVGLLLALSEHTSAPTIFFDACEPSSHMLSAGRYFWESFQGTDKFELDSRYRESSSLPSALPTIPKDTLRLVTAFHLTLPYNGYWDDFGESAKKSVRAALWRVAPAAGLFTCSENKEESLGRVVDSYSGWAQPNNREFEIPTQDQGIDRPSRFYTYSAPHFGFNASEGTPVRSWSRYRFSLPKGYLYLRTSQLVTLMN